ncbi:hypothetical protein JCM8547_007300 [Rhodosporidiobolus lusitaniae]
MPSLTDLPPELIQQICQLLFVPFSRQLVSSKIEIKSYERLALLCKIIEGSYAVGEHVKQLEIWLKHEVDEGLPKSNAVSSIIHSPTDRQGSRHPGHNQNCETRSRPSRYGPSPLRHGRLPYRTLNWLDYNVDRPLSTLGRYKAPSPLPIIELGGINLHGLLSIGQLSDGHKDVSHDLSSFPVLNTLTFRSSAFTSSALPVLHSLPKLKLLSFGPYSDISVDDILSLLGPMRPPSLSQIRFSNVYEEKVWDDYEECLIKIDLGWTTEFSRAEFPRVLTAAAAIGVKLVALAVERAQDILARQKQREEQLKKQKERAQASGA